jgi:hypothetical protein
VPRRELIRLPAGAVATGLPILAACLASTAAGEVRTGKKILIALTGEPRTSLNATRPSPTGTPGRAYTNNLRSYPLAERDSLLRRGRASACACCLVSSLMFWNASTAIEGLSGRASPPADGLAPVDASGRSG